MKQIFTEGLLRKRCYTIPGLKASPWLVAGTSDDSLGRGPATLGLNLGSGSLGKCALSEYYRTRKGTVNHSFLCLHDSYIERMK